MVKNKLVISLGGSLVVPNGIDIAFLKKFNRFIRKKLAENKNSQFFIVVGGGQIARHYRDAGKKVLSHRLTYDDLDWLGIHATRLNAHLIRTIFRDIAHPYVLKHYEIIRKAKEKVVVCAGWKPGWSTDYCAVLVCQDYGIKTILNLTNISQVYTQDPKKSSKAKSINKISWKEYRKLIGNKWTPGMNLPFDPVASKAAEKQRLKVVILNGRDFANLNKYFKNQKFLGTVIQ
ncbi:MAG: UMP kinase [Patescibacteria group bacterium]